MSNQICYNCSKYPNYSIHEYNCVCNNKHSCNICKNCTRCVYSDICKKKKRKKIKRIICCSIIINFYNELFIIYYISIYVKSDLFKLFKNIQIMIKQIIVRVIINVDVMFVQIVPGV